MVSSHRQEALDQTTRVKPRLPVKSLTGAMVRWPSEHRMLIQGSLQEAPGRSEWLEGEGARGTWATVLAEASR